MSSDTYSDRVKQLLQGPQNEAQRGYEINLSDMARKLLAKQGYDAVYGARPLKRVIQTQGQDRLADALLVDESAEDGKINIYVAKGEISVSREKQLVH